jgi:hypothetical protein
MNNYNPPDAGQKQIAFVAMCFDGRLQTVYQKVVRPVLENHGFACTRADEMSSTGIIMDQIRDAIEKATLVMCDLTFDNPNVFYEMGIAHVLTKPTIMISQNPANIPFDVKHWRIIGYADTKEGLLDLRDILTDTLFKLFPHLKDQEQVHELSAKLPLLLEDELQIQRTQLFSNSLDFKRYAIKFLGEYGDKASFDRIKHVAMEDPNPDIVRDAFTALYKIDPEKAMPLLRGAGVRAQKSLLVRERVVTLLGGYPADDELVHQMIAQLGDSSWGVRKVVCEVLGRWGDVRSIGPLQGMMIDIEPQVRLAAAEALERLYGRQAKNSSNKEA